MRVYLCAQKEDEARMEFEMLEYQRRRAAEAQCVHPHGQGVLAFESEFKGFIA